MAIWLAPVTTLAGSSGCSWSRFLSGSWRLSQLWRVFWSTSWKSDQLSLQGVFLGLVLGSVAIAWCLIKQSNTMHVVVVALVGLALFVVLGLGEGSAIGDPSPLALVGAGGLAICAMILPGISGSLILLMLGMYSAVLGDVTDRDFASLGLFSIGAVVGFALFSQILNWGLNNHHDLMVATLVGLMAGSTRVLWPWPNGVESVALGSPGEDWPAVLASALLGVVAVFLNNRDWPQLPLWSRHLPGRSSHQMVAEDLPGLWLGQRPFH